MTDHDCTMDVDGYCHGCELLSSKGQTTETEVALQESLFDIESNIRYAMEHEATVEEVGGAILRALAGGRRAYLMALQMAMELSK